LITINRSSGNGRFFRQKPAEQSNDFFQHGMILSVKKFLFIWCSI
jgi:hypothetical protein